MAEARKVGDRSGLIDLSCYGRGLYKIRIHMAKIREVLLLVPNIVIYPKCQKPLVNSAIVSPAQIANVSLDILVTNSLRSFAILILDIA